MYFIYIRIIHMTKPLSSNIKQIIIAILITLITYYY